MKETLYVLTRGVNPVVVSEDTLETPPGDSFFLKDCVAFVRKSYEGQIFGMIRETAFRVYTDDICVPMHIDAQKALREMKSNPIYRKYLEVKKVGSIVTEFPAWLYWDKANKDSGRTHYSFWLEHGLFYKFECDNNGIIRQKSCYYPNGNSKTYLYANGIRKVIKEMYEF